MLKDQAFRFRVVNSEGESSSDWRVWVQGGEAYASSRYISNQYKASFHSSGQCHVGISQELRASLVDDPQWRGKSRHFSTWTVDHTQAAQKPVPLVTLLFPELYLSTPSSKGNKEVEMLPVAKKKIAAIALLLISTARVHELRPADSVTPLRRLCNLPMPSGNSIVAYQAELEMPIGYEQELQNRFAAQMRAPETSNSRTFGRRPDHEFSPTMRAMLWDGRRIEKQWCEISAAKLALSLAVKG